MIEGRIARVHSGWMKRCWNMSESTDGSANIQMNKWMDESAKEGCCHQMMEEQQEMCTNHELNGKDGGMEG